MADTHFCGSVPLQSSDEVFRTTMKFLKNKIHRLPDGETGERGSWIKFQFDRLGEQDGIEVFMGSLPSTNPVYHNYPRFRLTKPAAEIEMPPLGYADPVLASYDVFSGLKQEGVIPEAGALPGGATHPLRYGGGCLSSGRPVGIRTALRTGIDGRAGADLCRHSS